MNVTTAQGGFAEVYFLDSDGSRVKALGDVRVRQALNYAIDRTSISKNLFQGVAEPTAGTVGSDFVNPDLTDMYPYDPDKAKQLLAEAGHPDGFEFGIVASTFGTLTTKPLMQAIAQNWADIGVEVDILEPGTTSELFEKFLTREAFVLEYSTQAYQLLSNRAFPGSYVNPYNVRFPELEEVLNEAQSAPADQQQDLLYRAEAITAEQAYSAPIATKPSLLYATDKIDGAEAKDWMASAAISRDWTPAS